MGRREAQGSPRGRLKLFKMRIAAIEDTFPPHTQKKMLKI